MTLVLQVVGILLVSISMALALAHALELPGKKRLDKQTYLAVQTIYYPGFTYGGFSEVLGMLVVLALLITTPARIPAFWCTLVAFLALAASHATYWLLTHPVNKFWMKDTRMEGTAGGFLSSDPLKRGAVSEGGSEGWTKLRDRWEYSHVLRAIFGFVALIALTLAIAIPTRL